MTEKKKLISKKELKVQQALGTMYIPKLIPLNLSKIDHDKNYHPDIDLDEAYLLQAENGKYYVGYPSQQWYGILFHVGTHSLELGNEEWKGIWLIKGEKDD